MVDFNKNLPRPPVTKKYIIGLDLGQSRDYTALIILETVHSPGTDAEDVYNVLNRERTRGTPYTEIVDRVKEIMAEQPHASLVVDQTGVGAPVIDMFERANLNPVGVMIHGGADESCEGGTWKVPKRNLAGVTQVLLQTRRLKIAPGPLRDILINELLNFRVKIDPLTAHDSYSAWREQDHDDLVLAVALAAWWGEHIRKYEYTSTCAPVILRGEATWNRF